MSKYNLYNIRVTARKLRLVADLIRHKNINDAINILNFSNKLSVQFLKKGLHSALHNAINNNGMSSDLLYVDKILINEGKTQKRFRPGPRGRTNKILKRTSHIKIELKERVQEQK